MTAVIELDKRPRARGEVEGMVLEGVRKAKEDAEEELRKKSLRRKGERSTDASCHPSLDLWVRILADFC